MLFYHRGTNFDIVPFGNKMVAFLQFLGEIYKKRLQICKKRVCHYGHTLFDRESTNQIVLIDANKLPFYWDLQLFPDTIFLHHRHIEISDLTLKLKSLCCALIQVCRSMTSRRSDFMKMNGAGVFVWHCETCSKNDCFIYKPIYKKMEIRSYINEKTKSNT